tara:strand:+ start:449 stop:730 length:282 start_codon:yes stop_codon:yes gene_type:complete
MTKTINDIFSDEIVSIKDEDINLKIKLSNEKFKRAERDSLLRIKLAEQESKIAEINSLLSIQISNENSESYRQIAEIKKLIYDVNLKLNNFKK